MTTEHFEIAFEDGRTRLTHVPTGDSVSRRSSLEGPDVRPWMARFTAFLLGHPAAHEIRDARGRVVGDARDYPAVGGGFAVGDFVVTLAGPRAEPVARRVMEAFEHGPRFQREADLAPVAYRLDDGGTLSYDQADVLWQAPTWTGGHAVTRRLLPSDDLEAIRAPAGGTLLQGILRAVEALAAEGNMRRRLADPVTGEESAAARELAEASLDALWEAEDPLWKKDPSDEAILDGLRALAAAREAIAGIAALEPAPPEGGRDRRLAPFHLSRVDAVIRGLEDRGVSLGVPASPAP